MKCWWYFALLVVVPVVASSAAETASQVFKQDSPSVVVILTYSANGKATELGSGVKLPDGAVATNCHVLKDGTTYKVRYQTKTYPATLAKSDWNRDVCTLTVPNLSAPPVVLGSTKNLQTGATVFAIGTPEGLQLTLSEGIVSSLRPVGDGSYIQTTAAISPGSSGGGLFDDQGRLLGLTSFYVSNGQQLNFALPVEWIEAIPYLPIQRAFHGTSEVDWINCAAALEKKNDWTALTVLAERWTKASPDSNTAWAIRGEAFGETNAYSSAIAAYSHALRINSHDASSWDNLGLIYDEAGQHAKSIGAERESLRINPRSAHAWDDLGTAYADAKQPEQAIDAYRNALRINPQLADAWTNLGTVYAEVNRYEQAIDAHRQALQIDPGNESAWTSYGIDSLKAQEYQQGIGQLRHALQIDPKDAKAWFALGLAYFETDQTDRAVAVYQHLKPLSPQLAEKLFNIVAPQ